MKYLHNIPVRLYDNLLTEDPNDLYARIQTNKSIDIEGICRSVIERTNLPIDADIMVSYVHKFLQEMLYRACDGFSINAEYFYLALHIKGTFNGVDDHFDPERHRIVAEFLEGALTRKYINENASVVVEGKAEQKAGIHSVFDVSSGTTNDLLTPNRNLKISGHSLRIAGGSADIGVYFVHVATGNEAKVAANDIVVNNPSELIVVTPTLTPDTYNVKVITQYAGRSGYLLKEPRIMLFDKPLVVV